MMSINEQQLERLSEFTKNVGISFNNQELLKEALTHRSYLNESNDPAFRHNERLEFLGDAVLELITTKFLFQKYQDRSEGDLTSFRAALVRTESLADEALRTGMGEYVFMSKGEESTGGRTRPYILANTFEAITGALYLDQGFEACEEFIHRELLPKIEEIVENRLDIDPKSKLQELAQELVSFTPSYQLKSAVGPDHNKIFVMEVLINKEVFGEGSGHSKQEAEQHAAQYALDNWEKLYKNYGKSVKISASE